MALAKPSGGLEWLYQTKRGTLTFRNLALVTTVIRYCISTAAMVYEHVISLKDGPEISSKLTNFGLDVVRHSICVRTYPMIILLTVGIAAIDILSLYVLESVIQSDKNFESKLTFPCVLLIEFLVSILYTLITPEPITQISNISGTMQISHPVLHLVAVTGAVYIPAVIGMKPVLHFLIVTDFTRMLVGNYYSDPDMMREPKNSGHLRHWKTFSPEFVEAVTKLMENVGLSVDACFVNFSASKYIDAGTRFVHIFTSSLEFYGEEALIGYIAFALGEMQFTTHRILEKTMFFNKIVATLLLALAIYKLSMRPKPLMEYIRVTRTMRNFEFPLLLFNLYVSRKMELQCDKNAVALGCPDELKAYIKAMGRDPYLDYSPMISHVMELFSPRNSLYRRLREL